MESSEAKKLVKDSIGDDLLERLYRRIKSLALMGYDNCVVEDLTGDHVSDILSKGYEVLFKQDLSGNKTYLIKWRV